MISPRPAIPAGLPLRCYNAAMLTSYKPVLSGFVFICGAPCAFVAWQSYRAGNAHDAGQFAVGAIIAWMVALSPLFKRPPKTL